MMLINWYRAKKAEFKVKAMFWGILAGVVDNHKSIIDMIGGLYNEVKGVSPEELRSEFISKMAEIIHAEREREKADEE